MKHECTITVIDKKCFTDYQEKYLADPKSGPWSPLRSVLNGGPPDLQHPFFNVGDEFILTRTPQQDDFYHLMNGKFCGEAWDAVNHYVYAALQGGSFMKGWTNDDRMMIACCNDSCVRIRLNQKIPKIREKLRFGSVRILPITLYTKECLNTRLRLDNFHNPRFFDVVEILH